MQPVRSASLATQANALKCQWDLKTVEGSLFQGKIMTLIQIYNESFSHTRSVLGSDNFSGLFVFYRWWLI